MNDHEAMDAINEVMEQLFEASVGESEAIAMIARITGMNHFEHAAAKAEAA